MNYFWVPEECMECEPRGVGTPCPSQHHSAIDQQPYKTNDLHSCDFIIIIIIMAYRTAVPDSCSCSSALLEQWGISASNTLDTSTDGEIPLLSNSSLEVQWPDQQLNALVKWSPPHTHTYTHTNTPWGTCLTPLPLGTNFARYFLRNHKIYQAILFSFFWITA